MKRVLIAFTLLAALVLVPVALAAGTLHGVYKTKIAHGRFKGTWTLDIAKGRYSVANNGHPVAHGKYKIKKHVITVGDTGGTGACNGVGRYRFKVTGTHVKFTRLSDAPDCSGRAAVLKHIFTKAS